MAYSVYLKKGEERRLLAGHSWVYANEAAKIEGDGGNGSLASVYAHDGRFIGKGYINHLSKILVRIFLRGEGEDDDAFYCKKIAEANALRERLVGGDNYRMVSARRTGCPRSSPTATATASCSNAFPSAWTSAKSALRAVLQNCFRRGASTCAAPRPCGARKGCPSRTSSSTATCPRS